jgi:hypothetical protein
MKKYKEIPRFGHTSTLDYFTEVASKRLMMYITLKIDGANGQFDVNDDGQLTAYSRENVLHEGLTLSGLYEYVHSKVDPSKLPKNMKVFGEWLVSHKVRYPQNAYKQFYIFDIYDTEKELYLSPDSEQFKSIVEYLTSDEVGMKTAPVLYYGPYKGMEHIESILKSVTREGDEYLGQEPKTMEEVFHEGIVVKAYDYRRRDGKQHFVKLVGTRFQELKKYKPKAPKGPDQSVERQIADMFVTEARVEKIIYKLVDNGELPQEFDLENMPVIAKNVPKIVFQDVMKEESDTIAEQFEGYDEKLIGKKIAGVAMNVAKEIVKKVVEERIKRFTEGENA